jgi:hypothetical protein
MVRLPQVQLAMADYQLPRLTRMWSHLERQAGGGQVRGMGEKQLEIDKRLLRQRMSALRTELDEVCVTGRNAAVLCVHDRTRLRKLRHSMGQHRVFLGRSSNIAGSIEHGVLMRPYPWWQSSVIRMRAKARC